ncbi:Hypothetical protein I595_3633 [Croceitalea dokdonensis DOKDO 023]|uniref:HTH luxR-type domain-containing protein n=1 Tax=Croceitalea dokdonensis DOKDO 023 TaxID=1300341 RepID=A0A0P7ARF3_9FLAO|nr:hypothetical protein [Croceitalea dokdonensis]KPM30337.1 Hypothetical protein I595_3633 [Croceitalea dokdonensis DOKDO 023]
MKFTKHLITFIFLFSLVLKGASQEAKDDFEKIYLEFHDKWDAGYDASLAEIDSIFQDCPDLERFPHYFIYKGDLLCHKGYYDLGLKYYLIAEKLIDLGYESKKIYDHRPIMYFKLGYAYADLYMPERLLEYINKGKAYLKDNYSFQTEYDFTELEAIYLYNHTDKKEQALDMLEALYAKASLHKNSPVYQIINTTRLRTIEFAMRIDDMARAKKLLNALKNDTWIDSIDGQYLRWYYSVSSDFYAKKKAYKKAILYNDSIYLTSPIELEDKESLFESYIKIHTNLGNDSAANGYKDSLSQVLKVQRGKRQQSAVDLIEQNDKYEKLVSSLSYESKQTKWFWGISMLIAALVVSAIVFWYGKRRRKVKKELIRERQKVELLNDNYQQLLKNYQFTTKQLEKIKHTLVVEIQKNKSPQIIALHKSISNNITSNFNEKLLSINKLRDQFILNLREQFPDLTNYESLICFYTKMGLSAKEIGQITNLTVRSIQSHQYRIGQKTKKQFNAKLKDFLEKVPLTMF